MSKTAELLLKREAVGLRLSLWLKVVFFLTMLAGSFSPEATHFERLYGSLASATLAALLAVFQALIRKNRRLRLVGILSAVLDGVFLTLIVIIWYLAVGGSQVSSAFLLKSTIYTFSAGLMILNCFALRPLYPAIVGAVFTASQLGFFAYSYALDGDLNAQTFNEHLLADRVSYFLYFVVHIAVPFLFGCVSLTYLTYIARRTVEQAVFLEKDKDQLQRYFSPRIAEKITAADEDFLKPGGTRTLVAVMFCDIRGFTKLSETLSPEQVLDLLSRYHARMVKVIFQWNGTLDKYIGDAIMATFGTPAPTPDDADNALSAALAMRAELGEFNAEQRAAGLPEVSHGIAINYGEAIVGNIGTRERLEYTVIGDTVNVASRMEALCKEYGADLLISESLRRELQSPPELMPLGAIRLRGKDEPVLTYQVP